MPPDTLPSIVDATDDVTTKANGRCSGCQVCSCLCTMLSAVVVCAAQPHAT